MGSITGIATIRYQRKDQPERQSKFQIFIDKIKAIFRRPNKISVKYQRNDRKN